MLGEEAVLKFRETLKKEGIIRVITHLDTDGLSSAAILIKALRRCDQQFHVRVVKQLEDNLIEKLFFEIKKQKCKAVFFLDLGSNKLEKIIALANFCHVVILDHHEVENSQFLEFVKNNPNITFINPELNKKDDDKTSASGVVYEFVKALDPENKELAQLAVLGMIGDMVDKSLCKKNKPILEDAKDAGMQVKRGPIVFSATRPIHKSLELNSSMFIPGVSGSQNGAIAFLRDLDIQIRTDKGYRTIVDLSEEEMSKLLTAIILARMNHTKSQDIIGDIYLMKFFGYVIDARELSTMLNACGRLNYTSLALAFLLGSKQAKDKIEFVYTKYRHHLINGLNFVNATKKIEGRNYMIINARENIRDTIIGTVTSILASSGAYPEGNILVGMAYRKDKKIKVSMRLSCSNRSDEKPCVDLCKILSKVVVDIKNAEVGGHIHAAGCLISKKEEDFFIQNLQKNLDIEEIKVAV
jgi:single-stranded-DNA-specific exonuclease